MLNYQRVILGVAGHIASWNIRPFLMLQPCDLSDGKILRVQSLANGFFSHLNKLSFNIQCVLFFPEKERMILISQAEDFQIISTITLWWTNIAIENGHL